MKTAIVLIYFYSLQYLGGRTNSTNFSGKENNFHKVPYLQPLILKKINYTDILEEETATPHYEGTTPKYPGEINNDPIPIIWHLATFGGLIMFFLLISYCEFCRKRPLLMPREEDVEVPPPPYDLFGPPSYDSLYHEKSEKNTKNSDLRRKLKVFVIPVWGNKIKNIENVPERHIQDLSLPPPP